MIKMLLAFVLAFGICYFGIQGFRNLTGKDKWALTKLMAYSTICALLAMALLIAIVLIF